VLPAGLCFRFTGRLPHLLRLYHRRKRGLGQLFENNNTWEWRQIVSDWGRRRDKKDTPPPGGGGVSECGLLSTDSDVIKVVNIAMC
jgi:hypothetical protein